MQDGDSTQERTKRNGGTIEQAHLMRDTRKQQLIMHVYKQEQKQERNAELQPNIFVTRAHLHSSTLQDWRHTHTHLHKTQKKPKWRLPLRAPSPSPRPQLPAPPAWSVSSCLAPHVLAARHHGRCFWERTGFSGAISVRTGGGKKPSILGVERERKWRTLRPTSGVSGPQRLRRTLGQELSLSLSLTTPSFVQKVQGSSGSRAPRSV